MISRSLFAAAAALLAVAAASGQDKPSSAEQSQDQSKAPKLAVGDKAAPVTVEKWLKGEPVTAFQPGKVYVVEFWATWCGPCIRSMPHLSALQQKYRDKGVTIIGTNIWEDAQGRPKYTAETLTTVENFVKEQGGRMGYTVAYDGAAKVMERAYMRAAGLRGIPACFIVDKTGTIAWIGHPMWLDIPLEMIVHDSWDYKTGPEHVAKVQQRYNAVFAKLREDPKAAVADWQAFERDHAAIAHNMANVKFGLYARAGEYEEAYKAAAGLIDKAIAGKDAGTLNEIAWTIVDPDGGVATKDLDLAYKAAVKADELTKHADPAIIDTLARVHFLKGNVDKAVELQKEAIALLKNEDAKAQFRKTLEEYEKAGK